MRRALRWLALVLAAALVVAGALWGPRLLEAAEVGAGYVAKQTCSCVYVAGRSLDACRPDLPVEMDRIDAALLDDAEGVRASVLLGLVERRALHHPGSGCTLY